jgi:hypothetical protein
MTSPCNLSKSSTGHSSPWPSQPLTVDPPRCSESSGTFLSVSFVISCSARAGCTLSVSLLPRAWKRPLFLFFSNGKRPQFPRREQKPYCLSPSLVCPKLYLTQNQWQIQRLIADVPFLAAGVVSIAVSLLLVVKRRINLYVFILARMDRDRPSEPPTTQDDKHDHAVIVLKFRSGTVGPHHSCRSLQPT